jgi:hypothetical protein
VIVGGYKILCKSDTGWIIRKKLGMLSVNGRQKMGIVKTLRETVGMVNEVKVM